MKTIKKAVCICLVFVMVCTLTIASADATNYATEILGTQDFDYGTPNVIEPRYGSIILGTRNTDYGVLTGSLPNYYSQPCRTEPWYSYEFDIQTSINSSVTMRRTTTKYAAVYQDTGLPGANGAWSGEHTTYNSNVDQIPQCCIYGDRSRTVLLYTTHEVSYTTSFPLYTVSQLMM